MSIVQQVESHDGDRLAQVLMDAAIMAARVALLLMTTGFFALIWSGDHPEQIAAANEPIRVVNPLPEPSGLSGQGALSSSLDAVPLPKGVVEGRYLIVDQSGRVRSRTVRSDEARRSQEVVGPILGDHYEVSSDQRRWHYIRIEGAAGGLASRRAD